MHLATRSLFALRLLPILALIGPLASAQTAAPGTYKGQTTQGDQITINIGQNGITSWSSAYTCNGTQFPVNVTVPTNSCPILASGNFQCGDPDPACGMASIGGGAFSNTISGVLVASTPGCSCAQVATFSASLSAPPGGSCVASARNLCLAGSRFSVEASWTSASGSGSANAVPLSDGTGYLWFFTADEVEVVVKLVDGCALNEHYWVFVAGLTNVKVVLTVTDTKTQAVKTYVNKLNTLFAPIADTSAFSSCP